MIPEVKVSVFPYKAFFKWFFQRKMLPGVAIFPLGCPSSFNFMAIGNFFLWKNHGSLVWAGFRPGQG
jgi:hypothetical protein